MGTATISKPTCASCGKELDESPSISPDKRKPCPSCGFNKRNFSVSITETLTLHGSIGLKGKRAGLKRPFIEVFSGPQWSHKFKKWIDKIRTIDREKDRYEEKVTDPESREVLHDTKEKLSAHVGHGSAKKRK